MKKVELLSPGGGFEELKAAIAAGADSVYIGAKEFSARAFAKNFTLDELKLAIEYCHERGKKIYLAINTLIYDNEFKKALDYINFAYKEGIDGVIVQDLGLLSLIRNNFPDLDIHASTQMTIHNSYALKTLKNFGVQRVVLARELSLDEIKIIRKRTDLEIEVFVHGALCICYSGQCLFSSIIFKRSGNRGQCAQVCRLFYEMLSVNKDVIDKGYLLSPRDISLLRFIPDLINAGVNAFKIEGRLKDKNYVYVVTSVFRKYIDLFYQEGRVDIEKQDLERLFLVFNRGNLGSGYIIKNDLNEMINKVAPNNTGLKIGVFYFEGDSLFVKVDNEIINGDIISFRAGSQSEILFEINNNIHKMGNRILINIDTQRKSILKKLQNGDVFLVKSQRLQDDIESNLKRQHKFRKIEFKIRIKKYQEIIVIAKSDEFETVVKESPPEIAKTKPTTYENVKNAFSKLNGTVFELEKIDIEIDDDVFVKVSTLNNLRRVAIDELLKKILQGYKRDSKKDLERLDEPKKILRRKTIDKSYSFLIDSYWQYEFLKLKIKDLKIEDYDIYVPYNLIFKYPFDKRDIVYFDRIMHDEELKEINASLIKSLGFSKLLIRNFGQYEIFKSDFDLYFDFSFNVVNSFAIDVLKKLNAKRICLSIELSKEQIDSLQSRLELEAIVFWKIPLMINKLRFFENGAFLRDRNGNLFSLKPTQTFKNEILNSIPLYINEKDVNVKFLRFDFSHCTKEEINTVLDCYFKNMEPKFRWTKGYYIG